MGDRKQFLTAKSIHDVALRMDRERQGREGKKKHPSAGGYAHKIAVLSLTERGGHFGASVRHANRHGICFCADMP